LKSNLASLSTCDVLVLNSDTVNPPHFIRPSRIDEEQIPTQKSAFFNITVLIFICETVGKSSNSRVGLGILQKAGNLGYLNDDISSMHPNLERKATISGYTVN
jgi:hypothetical protein